MARTARHCMPTVWERLPLVLTSGQVAGLMQVTDDIIRKWCASGKLPAVKFGKEWRIARDALRQCLEGTPCQAEKCPR